MDLRVRYTTDGAAQGNDPAQAAGIFVDDISVIAGGSTVFTDGRRDHRPTAGRSAGSPRSAPRSTTAYDNYYIASNRTYVSFDKYLKTGPYNFGLGQHEPDFVEHFPYQNGLLVSYWDTSQSDNNASQHPGEGEILPVDAQPAPAGPARRDAVAAPGRRPTTPPSALEKSDSFTLHVNGRPSYIRGQAAQPLFHDDASYWDASQPTASVKVPNTGPTSRCSPRTGTSMRIQVSKRD